MPSDVFCVSCSRPEPGDRESMFENFLGKQVELLDYGDDPICHNIPF